MKWTSTPSTHFKKLFFVLTCLIVLTLLNFKSYAQQAKERVYATSDDRGYGGLCLICDVSDRGKAYDTDLNSASTISVGLGVIGSAYQELVFPAKNTVGSSAFIKISTGTNLVGVNLGAFKFQAYNGNSAVGSPVLGTSAINLLASGNQFEVVIPAPNTTYDRVRVTVDGGLLAVSANLKVYHAYYLKDATSMVCDAPVDELHGISDNIVGLGAVDDAGHAIDASETSYSSIISVANVIGYAQQTAIFNGPSMPGDSVRMILSTGIALVELDLLKSIEIETFNGNTSNGIVAEGSGLLNLRLLSGAGNKVAVSFAPSGVFDRVQLRVGGLGSVLSTIRLYDVKRLIPTTVAINGTVANSGVFCAGQAVALTISNPQAGATYRWYTQATGGTATAGTSYRPTLVAGVNKLYVEATRSDCTNNSPRKEIIITVNDPTLPMLASLLPVCIGSTTTLQISSPVAGQTYRWYDVPNGGTSLGTGTSYTTGALSANKTFYVESVIGACSSPRLAVNVTVSPLPVAAQITTNDVSINAGESATLMATADAGNSIKWYANSTGGTALVTGNSYTTPILNATTIYYAESVNAAGCPSATRTAVTVTVVNGPGNPNCNAAVRQRTGIDGLLCLLCSVDGPGNSTDANLTNFTKINLAVGVATTGYQRLIFGKTGAATDSVRLDLEVPVGLADLSVLSGITVRVMNGTDVVSTYPLNSSLVNLRLLGGSRFKATVLANGAFDRVEVRFGGLLSALSSLSIYGAEIIYPNPTVSSTGLAICSGNSTTVTATANGGTTLQWFSAATGGTLLQTGASYTTPALTANATYYIEVSKAGCANTDRVPVTVVVTTVPPNPVVAAVPPICSGSSAVITVTGAVVGTDYNWYTTSTGTTPVFTGPTYTTPALTTNTTYYVQAANGTCLSPARTSVLVSVNPRPVLPQVQASATTINAGQTSVLTASTTDADIEFNWYTSSTSTTPVGTGATFVTLPLAATTTYYLEAKSTITGCTAPSRVQVTITVSGTSTPNPVLCEAPTLEVHGVTGVALLSGVFNAGLAIDNDTKTGSSLVMAVGALNASVYQRVGFTTMSNIGDTVRVRLSAPGKLLSLGLLSSLKVGTYSNTTSNNDGLSLNDPLIRLELLSGDSEALVSFVPTKQFNYIEVRLNSGIVGALNTIDLNSAQRVVVAPEVVSSNVAVCANATATLTVQNPKSGITYKWYNATGVYQTGKDGATFITPSMTANTTYFVEANAANCASTRTAVAVTVTQAPVVPVLVSSTINTCSGSDVVISVNNPITGIVYKWYNSADVYQVGKDGPTFAVNNVLASTTYKVEAVNSCGVVSAKVTATISVGTLDAPVVSPISLTVSSGSPAVLNASSSSAGAVFSWYDSATATTSLATGAQFVSPPLVNSGTSPITVTYYVSASLPGGCPPSARASIVVTILPAGINTDVPCEGATVQVRQGVDGVVLLGGVFNPGLAVDNKAQTVSSLVMPVGVLGASVYQHVGFSTMSVLGDTVRIRVSSPGKLLSLAVLPSIELTTYKGLVSNGDMVMASNPLIKVELLSDNSGATFSFVPTKQFDGIELRLRSGLASVLTSLDFNYTQRVLVAPKLHSANVSACVGSAATLAVQNPVAGTVYKWYKGTTYLTGKDGTTLTTETTLAAGTYDYFVSATRNGCESAKVKATVTIFATPVPPVAAAGNPATACLNTSVTLGVNVVNGVTFKWYDALTGGNLLASNSATYTTPVFTTAGVFNYYVEAVNGNGCGSTTARTKITVTVNPSALASDITVAGANTSFCAGTTATLTASTTTVTNPVFTWYSDVTLSTVVFTGAQFKTPTLTTGVTYYVTVKGSNKCENTSANAKAVSITVTPPSVAADINIAGLLPGYCSGTSATLTASSTTVTNPVFTWYSNSALTNVAFTGAVFNLPSLTATATYYVTVRGTNKCENTAATAKVITITVNPTPEPPVVASAGTNVCSGDAAVLSIQNAQSGLTYDWYGVANGGTILFTGPKFTTPVLTANTDYYVVASSPTGCGNATARVKVTISVSSKPLTPTVASSSLNACIGSTAVLNVSNPQTGITYKWYAASTGGTSVFTGTQFTTPAITATITYYVEASSASCTNGTRTSVVVNATASPTAPTSISGGANPLCSGTSVALAVNNPVAGITYKWYTAATGGTAVFEGTTFNTPALTAATTYYVEAVNATGCTSSTRTSVVLSVQPVLSSPVVAVQTVTNNSITFKWDNVTGATGYEVSLNGGSTWIQLGSGVNTYLAADLKPGQTVAISVRAVGQLACQTSGATTLTSNTDNPLSNEIFVPNTFTPNGDGHNDILYVYGNSIAKLRLRVYNQWGEFIYESLSIQNGWDGTYKGRMQPNGVYVYQLELTLNDGTKATRKGTITLLR